jgi:hypothetical protein
MDGGQRGQNTWRSTEKLVLDIDSGYESPDIIPDAIKQGMLIHIAHFYDGINSPTSPLPPETLSLYKPYRLMRI